MERLSSSKVKLKRIVMVVFLSAFLLLATSGCITTNQSDGSNGNGGSTTQTNDLASWKGVYFFNEKAADGSGIVNAFQIVIYPFQDQYLAYVTINGSDSNGVKVIADVQGDNQKIKLTFKINNDQSVSQVYSVGDVLLQLHKPGPDQPLPGTKILTTWGAIQPADPAYMADGEYFEFGAPPAVTTQ